MFKFKKAKKGAFLEFETQEALESAEQALSAHEDLSARAEQVDGLNDQITNLTTERDTLQGQVDSLTTERDDARNELTTANQSVTDLTSERDTLQSQLNDANARLAAVSTEGEDSTPPEPENGGGAEGVKPENKRDQQLAAVKAAKEANPALSETQAWVKAAEANPKLFE